MVLYFMMHFHNISLQIHIHAQSYMNISYIENFNHEIVASHLIYGQLLAIWLIMKELNSEW